MIDHRPLESLGVTDLEWLRARHHFCFAGYQRADRMGWGRLRVINHHELAAGAATKSSSHNATELLVFAESEIAIVRHGARRIRVGAGDVVSIFTGTGIELGIANPGQGPARFTTVWLNCEPDETPFLVRRPMAFRDTAAFIASGFGGDRADLRLKVPARVRRATMARGTQQEYALASRKAYLLVLDGELNISGHVAGRHDGVAIDDEPRVTLTAALDATALVMEV